MRRAWMTMALCAFVASLAGCEAPPEGSGPAVGGPKASTTADPTETQQQQLAEARAATEAGD